MEGYTLFRTFVHPDEFKELIQYLESEKIPHSIQKIKINLIPYLMTSMEDEYGLFIKNDHLSKVEKMITSRFKKLDLKDHPLNQMTEQELTEILQKQDEWSLEEVLIARRILESKGQKITGEDMAGFKAQRLQELKVQRQGNKQTLLLGFLFPVIGLLSSFYIGFIGTIIHFFSIGIALNFMLDFKRLPIGTKIKTFEPRTRMLGFIIILWAVLSFVLTYLLLAFVW